MVAYQLLLGCVYAGTLTASTYLEYIRWFGIAANIGWRQETSITDKTSRLLFSWIYALVGSVVDGVAEIIVKSTL